MATNNTESACAEETYGCYVYGIAKCAAGLLSEGLPQEGIDPSFPVYTLPYQAIQAIVSKVSLREFGLSVLEENLRDLSWLAGKAHRHEQILEAVQERCTLIPLRLGIIFSSEDRVREILVEYHDLFAENLARLEGKHEWGVKVYVNTTVLTKHLDELSDQIHTLTEEMATKSGGAAYVWKKRLENAITGEMERICDGCAQLSHDRLQRHASEACLNHLPEKESPDGSEIMILNGAYLVTTEQRNAFGTGLAELEEEYGGYGVRYQLSGPWPPYNFVPSSLGKVEVNE